MATQLEIELWVLKYTLWETKALIQYHIQSLVRLQFDALVLETLIAKLNIFFALNEEIDYTIKLRRLINMWLATSFYVPKLITSNLVIVKLDLRSTI